jgi:branched-chain amino acid transport system substrate-binding protein
MLRKGVSVACGALRFVRGSARRSLALVSLAAVLAGCGGAAAPAGQGAGKSPGSKAPIEIGWIGGLTGPLALDVLDSQKGTDEAVAEVNAKGGVLGRPVKVLYEDTGIDPQKARQAVEQLVLSDHVPAIIGDYYSPNTLAVLPLLDKYQVPMVSENSNATPITHTGHKYIFRVVSSSNAQVKALVLYAMDTLHMKRFVLFGGTDAYSQSNLNAFRRYATPKGAAILGEEQYNRATTKDFSPYLIKYRHRKFDAIFLGGGPLDSALIIKQARAMGLTEPFLGTNSSARGVTWATAGNLASGLTMAVDNVTEAVNYKKYGNPATDALAAAWGKGHGGKLPNYDESHAYDATMLLLRAIQKAGSLKGPQIRQAILQVGKTYRGAAADFSIEPNGGARIQLYIVRWEKDGRMRIVAKLANKEIYGS